MLVCVTGIAAAVLHVRDPKAFGEAVGRFAFVIAAIVFGLSCLGQSKGFKLALAIGAALLVLGGLGAIGLRQPDAIALGPAEHAPLVSRIRNGEPRLAQETLGFSLHDPGPAFQDLPAELAAKMISSDETRASWGRFDPKTSQVLLISFWRQPSPSAKDLEEFAQGVRKGMAESMQQHQTDAALETLEEATDWPNRKLHAHYRVGSAHFRLEIVAGRFGQHEGMAAIQAIDPKGDGLAELATTLARD